MRIKEVEKAIERLKNGKNTVCFGGNTAIYFIKDVETALSYIEELEEEIEKNKKIIENILTENNLIG